VDGLQGLKTVWKQFVSSTFIACCSLSCHIHQLNQEQFVYPLLRMLRIQPDFSSKKCPNISYLFSLCDNRRGVMKGVLRLCKDAMKSKSSTVTWDWLSVLPICHFLSGACEPFASPKLNALQNDFSGRAEEFGYVDVLRKKSLRGYILYSTLIRDKGVCICLPGLWHKIVTF
jgi:hypothetical protein